MERLVLKLELDLETFLLHFKGSIHCTSLPHVICTEPQWLGVVTCIWVFRLCLGHGCLVVGERC